jgi:hypothetical protein
MKTRIGLVAGLIVAAVAALVAVQTASAGLIVHYTFDGGSGTTAIDSATGDGSNNGTIVGVNGSTMPSVAMCWE